ncbi:MAG: C45 family autoproteolytic acyltransferase/hydrolase, partial [Planctomycetota bacterium]
DSGSFFKLNKSIKENGRIVGKLTSLVLKRRIKEVKKIRKDKKISETELSARIKDFIRLVKKLSPHWLVEVKGMALGAGVREEDLLLLNCLPSEFYPPVLHCTSFMKISKKKNILLKIRDERNFTQSFMVKAHQKEKFIQAGTNIGNIGYAHFLKYTGFACGNNTGSKTSHTSDETRLSDCHLMRYFAENADSIENIPALYEKLLKYKAPGGAGKGRGAIFIFVDKTGGAILETVEDDYTIQYVKSGTRVIANHFLSKKAKSWESEPSGKNTLLRYDRMSELLKRVGSDLSVQDVFAITRDRKNIPHALCNDDSKHFWMTISAQLQEIDCLNIQNSKNYICCGNTRHSFYLNAPITLDENYKPLLNGDYYKAADKCYQKYHCSANLRANQNSFEKDIESADFKKSCIDSYKLLKSI